MSEALNFEHYPLEGHKLPSNWLTVSISQVARSVASGFPSGAHNAESKGVPHIRPMNIDREGRFDLTSVKYVEGEPSKLLGKGDVLFNNTNSPELIGKTTAILVDTRLAYSNHMTRIQLEDGLSPVFVARQLHFLWMSGYFRHRCKNHVNQASISAEPLADSVPLLLPPLAEQERIADALDELLSDLDAGVAALERVQAKLKHYRAALLKATVEGALTADWRAQHPAAEPGFALLTRILAERRRRWEEAQLQKFKETGKEPPRSWKEKYTEPQGPDLRQTMTLPSGWHWVSLDQLLWRLRSGTAETSGRESTDHPVLKSSAVRHGVIDFTALNYLQASQSSRSESYLQSGDFLITRLSGSIDYVGCSAVVAENVGNGIQYPDRIFCGKSIDAVKAKYLTYCFRHSNVRRVLEAAAKSTAGHQRISLSDLAPLTIPLPPLAEQEAIIDIVEDQLSVIDHLEADLEAKLKSAQALRQSILRHAFTGKLVPQDPKDEPANELLKRIAVQRKELARQVLVARKTKPKAPPIRGAKNTKAKHSND